jgi:isoquinoline 1-oxidoreductase beta subunit
MLSRRGFIVSGAAVGGGLILAYGWSSLDDGDAAEKFAALGQPGAPLNAWLKISPDNTITCAIHRAEMGQGVTTSLAMLLAEELNADWADIRFEFAPTDLDYYNFGMLLRGQPLGDPAASFLAGTGTWAIRQAFHAMGTSMTISSSSTIDAWDTLRPAGASARQMLIGAAARTWQCKPDTLRSEAGWVIETGGEQRRASFGELAEAASRESPPTDVELKDPSDWQIVGHDVPRLDGPMKATGRAEFGIDVVQPDMLHATIVHSPVAGTTVASFTTNGAETMPGVEGIYLAGKPGIERAVAVVARDTWLAMQAAARISIVPGPDINQDIAKPFDSAALGAQYFSMLDKATDNADSLSVFRDDGDVETVIGAAQLSLTAKYEVPYLAHVCMEPMNCTALFTGDALEVWAPCQAHSVARDVAAEVAGLEPEQVTVHTTFMGGGFGRRAEMDYVEQATAVARQLRGRPVKLTWSREQDIRHDQFRPLAVAQVRGALDTNNALSAMDYSLATQSVVASYEARTPTPRGGDARKDSSVATSAINLLYPLDAIRVRYLPIQSHVPVGYWRSVSHSWNTFFIESFMDELAALANTDPLDFRQQALAQRTRHLAVLNHAAEAADWSPDNPNQGIALAASHDTIVAHVVEVATDKGLFKRVKRVVCAVDCGPVIHPDNVRAQMEGSIIDGLSAALYGQVDIEQGEVVQANFDTYRRMRITEAPQIQIHLIDGKGRPGGVGEPGVPGVAPALTNAIFAATGRRIRKLPVISA